MSGVAVPIMIKSISKGSTFPFANKSCAAFMAKYDVPLSASLRILLSLIPVREVSSFVSTIVSILCLKEQSQEHRLNSGYCGCNFIHGI
jgi:hypothetical protein